MSSTNGVFWDLDLRQIITPKTGESRIEFKTAGYGMTFERCLKNIIMHRMEIKQEVFTLKEFLDSYIATSKEITTLLNESKETN